MLSYSSRAVIANRLTNALAGDVPFGIVAGPRMGPMASCPRGGTSAVDGPFLRFRETADCRVHRLLGPGPPVPRPLLQGGSARAGGSPPDPRPRVPRLRPLYPPDEAPAARPPGGREGREADATDVSSLFHPTGRSGAASAAGGSGD